MLTVQYFARFREELGTSREQLPMEGFESVECVLKHLSERGDNWARILGDGQQVQIAVNQDMARRHTPIKAGDEVAFFPPVTGG
ncbi:MAG: molybdopterin converting factor subunit 1 [Hydrogenovibrio sp.]|uniref:molybdopterin converting factor subunit 1 n=1 Tax=Hydrogenovibrio TaxID=28884 RepID=UPI00036D3ABD|nr:MULTISPECIES: molybdopterin converting factor subunit 1 [Hydrogenovibrio]MDR9498323.1 molybdopterin converting factor subunit 1 [Hydrogenovibrio sp.]